MNEIGQYSVYFLSDLNECVVIAFKHMVMDELGQGCA